jgi:hypothetical protein
LVCKRQRAKPKDIAFSLYLSNFLASILEILQKSVKDLSTKVISTYENGYRNTNRKKIKQKKKD